MEMKKLHVFAFMILLSTKSFSQANETDQLVANKDLINTKKAANAVRPPEDKLETIEVTGVGNISFIVSNKTDGSLNAYNHSNLILLPVTTTAKNYNYQLIFYGHNDKVLYAVENEGNKVSIYYPISMYNEIKIKLEQSLNQKRKVVMKLVQKTDGFRECVLQF